jgi:hypothetical protein
LEQNRIAGYVAMKDQKKVFRPMNSATERWKSMPAAMKSQHVRTSVKTSRGNVHSKIITDQQIAMRRSACFSSI